METSLVGVAGAGFMGSGIAESVARAGAHVVLYEPDRSALDRSRSRIEASVQKAVARGKLEEPAAAELIDRISWHDGLDALEGSELVVEAVYEDPEVKGRLFAELDKGLPAAAVLASNTSSIPIAQTASWTDHPERVLGLHFFSPVPVMKLVEVVVGLDTADAALTRAEAFAEQIGKHPIRTKDRSGFIVNALLVPYLMTAVRLTRRAFP